MRKRSAYRPKGVILNTLKWVTDGFKPLTSIKDENVKLRIKNHSAFESLVNGTGVAVDIDLMIAAANMCTALSRVHGGDWKEEIRQGVDAVESVRNRWNKWGKAQLTGDEKDAIAMLLGIHDAQLDACVINDLDKAIKVARSNQAIAV